MSIENLAQYFGAIEDPRCPGKVEHRLLDILVIAVCAVVACAESWCDIALYGRSKLQYCSLCEPDSGFEIDAGDGLWSARAQRIAAHLAFDAAWHLPTTATHGTLFQDFVQNGVMQGTSGPRGKVRRTAAAGGGRHAQCARRRGGRGPRRLSKPLRA